MEVSYDKEEITLVERVEMVVVYQMVIGIVKLQSKSVWNCFSIFFTGNFDSCKDSLSLTSQNIIWRYVNS